MIKLENFAVYGGGSWGTALACHIGRVIGKVDILVRDELLADEINNYRRNSRYLPGVTLDKSIKATCDIEILKGKDAVVIAVPSYAFDQSIEGLKQLGLKYNTALLIATKGISQNPIELFSSKIRRHLPNSFAFIAGPNFAREVAIGLPTCATIASDDPNLARSLIERLDTGQFRLASCDDVITIQIAGIVKNIIAIKSGILMAKEQGENAKASLITMGLKEIATIAAALGGNRHTVLEPGVVGDLILTAYSITSRNTKFGYEFHLNNYSREFLRNYPVLIEGVEAARLIKKLVDHNLNIPVISSVVELVA